MSHEHEEVQEGAEQIEAVELISDDDSSAEEEADASGETVEADAVDTVEAELEEELEEAAASAEEAGVDAEEVSEEAAE
ncbi:hypothetical protein ACFQZE_20835 [Paenibacillus sp. GCM10027627]|uniref:hypothetical protein n=1 Tax=unclassified Paenibacillus TaxID=185978 RepID=UPI00362FFC23